MQQYPSIEKQVIKGQDYYIFDEIHNGTLEGVSPPLCRARLVNENSPIVFLSKSPTWFD